MNKDTGGEDTDALSIQARIKLHISADNVESELDKCRQVYFDQEDCKGEKTLMQLIKCLECS